MNQKFILPFIILAGVILAIQCGNNGSITQVPKNHSPILKNLTDTTTTIGDTLKLWLKASDIDADSLTYVVTVEQRCADNMSGYSPEAEIDSKTGYFWFVPKVNDLPLHKFMFTVIDNRGGWDFDSLIVAVRDSIIPDIELSELLSAPVELEWNGHRLIGDAYVWRYYFRNWWCWSGGYISSCMLIYDLNNVITPDIELKYMWVVHEKEIWVLAIEEKYTHKLNNGFHTCILNGPPWRPGSSVDVIIGAVDPTDPMQHLVLLRSTNVFIEPLE